MNKKRVYVLIEGRVQGVFFRATARDLARKLKIKGWIRNRRDGKVELTLEGEEDAVDKMLDWCHQGPSGALVTRVEIKPEPFKGEFEEFTIKY